MKTLKIKSIVLGLALLVVTNIVKADEPKTAVLTRAHAVTSYVSAMTAGNDAGFSEVIDQSAKFSILRGKKVMSFDKAEMLEFTKQNKNIKQSCVTTTSEVESNDDMSVVKVEMKYENFTRTNYVTVANTGDGWKITNVYSVFK